MKSFIAIITILVLASLDTTRAFEVFDRPCRTPEALGVKTGFQPNQFLGRWYEIERYEQTFQVGSDCTTADYSLNADGSIRVFNQAVFLANGTRFEDVGRAVISFPNQVPLPAMLNVTFGNEVLPSRANYWVLSTDYSSYAFVVSCFNTPIVNTSRESYWLLSRSPAISAASRTRANELVDKHLERNRIRTTIQDNVKCGRIPGRSFH